MGNELAHHIANVIAENKTKRTCFFEYQGQGFWLKQTEKLKGVWRWLKPDPHQTLQKEIKILQQLRQKTDLVPEIITWGEDFLVLRDAGQTVNNWVNDDNVSAVKKQQILNDSAKALAQLHQLHLAHGRPALRDIAWHNGIVQFIDFESTSQRNDLRWKQIRDLGTFIHAMFREKKLNFAQIDQSVMQYRLTGGEEVWLNLLHFMHKVKFLYYILFIFKPIARTDLIAILKVSEYLLNQVNQTKNGK